MKSKTTILLMIILGCASAWSCGLETPDMAIIELETETNPVIYGEDDRVDYYQATSAQQGAANSVFVVVDDSELECVGGNCTLSTVPYTDWFSEGLCEDEPFRNQPTIGYCTAFLVGEDRVATGTDLVIIGHPYTLPQKIAGGAQVQGVAKNYFTANLDDYGGNSGSPVFDADTMVVQGILVRGNPDYVYDAVDGCWRSNVCLDTGCPGFEEASHTLKIAKFVPTVPCYEPSQCQENAD